MDVLIVDDEESMVASLSIVLKEGGFEVESARSVPGAIARLQSKIPDAVIVDKNLPDFSGGELVRYIRETHGDLPVLLITAFATAANAKEMLNLGVDDYLEKPFSNVYSVVGAVRDAIKRRQKRTLDVRPRAANRLLVISNAAPDAFAFLESPSQVVSRREDITEALDTQTVTAVVIDTSSFPAQETIGLVGMVRRRSTTVRVVIFSDTTLKVQLLRNLIGAGVDGLAESPAELKGLLTDFASR